MRSTDIVITDADIDKIEEAMGNEIHFDEKRRSIIKNVPPSELKDVQAFPGTGKTTLLIAKLGILAKKWRDNTSGICVLSFTNAAREEVQKRLGGTVYGEKLLSYPHFIGTFHAFFSKFVVTPWARSQGVKIINIDSDITLARRRKMVGQNYAIRMRGGHVALELSMDQKPTFSLQSSTGQLIFQKINESIKEGYLTYDEVLFFANHTLDKRPEIASFISNRFPLLFIDEAQDTSATLWKLVQRAFVHSKIQTLGDLNQSIYSIGKKFTTAVLPRSPHYYLADSRRLTSSVAMLANPLAISGEKMVGINTAYSGIPATIIVFRKESILKVLPTFGRLILNNFNDEQLHASDKLGCFAVGRVHRLKEAEDAEKHFPANVSAYFLGYDPVQNSNRRYKSNHFIDYVRNGRSVLQPGTEYAPAVKVAIQGLIDFCNTVSKQKYIVYENPLSVFRSLLTNDELFQFRTVICHLLTCPTLSEQIWCSDVSTLSSVLRSVVEFDTSVDFMLWRDESVKPALVESNVSKFTHTNKYTYSSRGREVQITLGSINSVKGQTHLATLLLDTYFRKHEIKAILPSLEGEELNPSRDAERRAINYVALTRAEGMICVAMPDEEMSPNDKEKLVKRGWTIVRI